MQPGLRTTVKISVQTHYGLRSLSAFWEPRRVYISEIIQLGGCELGWGGVVYEKDCSEQIIKFTDFSV